MGVPEAEQDSESRRGPLDFGPRTVGFPDGGSGRPVWTGLVLGRDAVRDLVDDLLVDPAADQLFAHANGVLDRPRVRSAVADRAIPVPPQHRRTAVLLPVVLLVDLLHHRLELLEQVRRVL